MTFSSTSITNFRSLLPAVNPTRKLVAACLTWFLVYGVCPQTMGQGTPSVAKVTANDDLDELKSWIKRSLRSKNRSGGDGGPISMDFGSSDPKEQIRLLTQGIVEFEAKIYRNECIKALLNSFSSQAVKSFSDAVAQEKIDLETQVTLLRLIALHGDRSRLKLFETFIKNENASVRSAAIDGFSILRDPAYPVWHSPQFFGANKKIVYALKKPPGIRLEKIRAQYQRMNRRAPIALKTEYADLFRKTIRDGVTAEERQAAARALVNGQGTENNFRLAEWGVWITDDNKFELLQSVVDEIPPFVHRTQNRLPDLVKRVNQIMVVTKPIIHLTVKRPMSVDIGVTIKRGQPWFAYPKPQDFSAIVGGGFGSKDERMQTDDFDALIDEANEKKSLKDPFSGYPWIQQPPRRFGSISGGVGSRNDVQGLGLDWQSLIVLPKKAAWMQAPDVKLSKHQWWSDLRDVESSWVSGRGEAERFLYYDGPTLFPCKYSAKLAGQNVAVQIKSSLFGGDKRFLDPYRGLYISVSKKGKVIGHLFEMKSVGKKELTRRFPNALEAKTEFSNQGSITGKEKVAKALLYLIQVDGGLIQSEAKGMVDVWKKEFLETPGRRVLFRIERAEYDRMCPIRVRPKPTEVARVGIVLAKLGSE